MRFTVGRKALLAAVVRASHAAAKRTTLPVLEHLLIRAGSDRISVAGDCLDWRIQTRATAHIEKEGAATVSAARLLNLLKSTDAAEVRAETMEGNKLRVQVGRYGMTLESFPETEFPMIADLEGQRLSVFWGDFERLFAEVGYAISGDAVTRPQLGCLCLRQIGNELYAYAADGCRAARDMTVAFEGDGDTHEIMVPERVAREIVDVCKGWDGRRDIGFARWEDRLQVFLRDTVIWCMLPGMAYPDVDAVIPTSFIWRVAFDPHVLADDIRMARKQMKRPPNMLVYLRVGEQTMRVSLQGEEDASDPVVETECACAVEMGLAPDLVVFNADWLLDCLGKAQGGFRMQGNDMGKADAPSQAVVFTSAFSQAKHVLMPTNMSAMKEAASVESV
jgi:DNA polymerase-3 subunit beta